MIGERYGRYTVVESAGRKGNHRYWSCVCDCGQYRTVEHHNLLRGHSTSCGCYKSEKAKSDSTTHGYAKTRTYTVWASMIARCHNPNNKSWRRYGGRGISVCEAWQNSFEQFLADMGESPTGMDIDRVDNNKGYYKENCRWASRTENCRNRWNSLFLTANGQTRHMSEWAEVLGIKYHTLYARMSKGWTSEDIINTPFRTKRIDGAAQSA